MCLKSYFMNAITFLCDYFSVDVDVYFGGRVYSLFDGVTFLYHVVKSLCRGVTSLCYIMFLSLCYGVLSLCHGVQSL